ncbi:hypothetical protein XNW1_4900011 [Xenorhabdus nematophila str. Websteri]|nr:hypothetical protein XNW1_1470011 [Xenorhabdus nematophila str. Websteri]CEF33711.1 hypothetical protein XNW1_4900011 [Xenorhabdus nematophila str. Websteri]
MNYQIFDGERNEQLPSPACTAGFGLYHTEKPCIDGVNAHRA